MAHGGARPGAGRKPGTANRKTREIADRAAAEGVTPLEFMLGILRDETQAQDARYQAAKDAAPYMHARLSAVDATLDARLSQKKPVEMTEEELLAVAAGSGAGAS